MASQTYAGIPMENIAERLDDALPFDPRTEVSADAKYIVKNLVLWFLVAPIVLGILAAVVINAVR